MQIIQGGNWEPARRVEARQVGGPFSGVKFHCLNEAEIHMEQNQICGFGEVSLEFQGDESQAGQFPDGC